MAALSSIEINLDGLQKGLRLLIDCRLEHTLFDEKTTAAYHNEARYQLVEGCFYDYEFTDADFSFDEGNEKIVQSYKRKPNMGRLAPNIYVGTLSLPIIQKGKEHPVSTLELEVRSIKSGYRDDYRDMLEGITEKCTDLLLQANSPVSHYFDVDHGKDSKTRYQKFSFIKSVLDSDEFAAAVHRIVSAPVTKWHEILEPKDVRQIKRLSNANCKELVKGSNRSRLPEQHYMRNYGITSLPERITTNRKTDSLDTPENRFVKHALETFLKFCSDIHRVAGLDSRLQKESFLLIKQLESQLHHSVFKDVSRPTTLKLNSPVLQRKEGYREVLRVWLMFDLAAKLIWTGGEDVYSGGKKDIATLYEYWLFFKLLDVLQSLFDIEPSDISDLIKPTADGLNLVLKQGEITAMNGTYSSGSRKLRVRFNYNRSFSGRKKYPKQGSWTTTLRPDYTLSLWPAGITDIEAEEQELIVHVHFDAKYKVANFMEYINEDADNLNAEKLENREGIYKNADLLKMHAYKDAIRRTGGAYVLYPGGIPVQRQGFHEIIPGLGAFPVRPSKTDSGVGALKNFIREIVEHFINRTSQREKVAYRTYKIHKDKPRPGQELKEPLPETYNENRDLLPDDTHVLVGFYKSQQQYEWITSRNLYNFRTGTKRGSLVLDKATVGASYLLLHTSGDTNSGDLWKIVSNGPKVFSKEDMLKKGYPDPKANYLVVEIEKVEDPAFANVKWDFRKLAGFGNGRGSGIPFASSLAALMRVKVMP